MGDFVAVMQGVYEIMLIEFTVYGYTITMWDVFMWSTLATIAGVMIVRFMFYE